MLCDRKVVLIGSMGAGKTSLGRRLAKKLGWEFIDTDHEICRKTGVDIPTIFDREGEAGFRRREQSVLADVLSRKGNAIIACGGGIILRAANRHMIAKQFLVVFLDVSVERQLQRIGADKNRPLADVADQKAQLQQLRDDRLGLYEGMADVRINTDANNFAWSLSRLLKVVTDHSNKFD